MTDHENDNPEFYPIYLIVDRSLLPPELSNDFLSNISTSSVNMDGDILLITRDQVDDASFKDKRKRGTMNDPKSKAATNKTDPKRRFGTPGTPGMTYKSDEESHAQDALITITDDMADRLRELIPRLVDEKIQELTERRRMLLLQLSDDMPNTSTDDRKKRNLSQKATSGSNSTRNSRPQSRSNRTGNNANGNNTAKDLAQSSINAISKSHAKAIALGLKSDDGTPLRIPVFVILDDIIRKAGDAQRLANFGFLLSLILIPRLTTSTNEPIYYIQEKSSLISASELETSDLNTNHNTLAKQSNSVDNLSQDLELLSDSSATPGVAMTSMTFGAAAAAIYRLSSNDVRGLEADLFPKLPGELAILVTVDMRFTHLCCKFLSIVHSDSRVTMKPAPLVQAPEIRTSRKDKRSNMNTNTTASSSSTMDISTSSTDGSASNTANASALGSKSPNKRSTNAMMSALTPSNALASSNLGNTDAFSILSNVNELMAIAVGEVRYGLRKFAFDRYTFDVWTFGVPITELPVANPATTTTSTTDGSYPGANGNGTNVNPNEQLYHMFLDNVPPELIRMDTIVYALCQQAADTAIRTNTSAFGSIPPPTQTSTNYNTNTGSSITNGATGSGNTANNSTNGMNTSANATMNSSSTSKLNSSSANANASLMKGQVFGFNTNISLTNTNLPSSITMHDFTIPSGPGVVRAEIDTVEVLQKSLNSNSLVDYMNTKLKELVLGPSPDIVPTTTSITDPASNTSASSASSATGNTASSSDDVKYEKVVNDVLVVHSNEKLSSGIAKYCSRTGSTLEALLMDPESVLAPYAAVLRSVTYSKLDIPTVNGAGLPIYAGGDKSSTNIYNFTDIGVIERNIALAILHNIKNRGIKYTTYQRSNTNANPSYLNSTSGTYTNVTEMTNEEICKALSELSESQLERAIISLAFEHMLCYPGIPFNVAAASPIHASIVGNLPVTYFNGAMYNNLNTTSSFQSALGYRSLLYAHTNAVSTLSTQICSISPTSMYAPYVIPEDAHFNADSDLSAANYSHYRQYHLQENVPTEPLIPTITNDSTTDMILNNLMLSEDSIPQVTQLLNDVSVQNIIEQRLIKLLSSRTAFQDVPSISDNVIEFNVNHGPTTGTTTTVHPNKTIGNSGANHTPLEITSDTTCSFNDYDDNNFSIFRSLLSQKRAAMLDTEQDEKIHTIPDNSSWVHLPNEIYNRNIVIPYTPESFLFTMKNLLCDNIDNLKHIETTYVPILDAMLVSSSSKPNVLKEKYQRWSTFFCSNLNFSEWSAAPAFIRHNKPQETFKFTVPHTGELEYRSKILYPRIGYESYMGKIASTSGRSKWRTLWIQQDSDYIRLEDNHVVTVQSMDADYFTNYHTSYNGINNTVLSPMYSPSSHHSNNATGFAGYSNSAATRAVIIAGKDSRITKIVRSVTAKTHDNYRLYATYEDDTNIRTQPARVCKSDVAASVLSKTRFRAKVRGLKVSIRDTNDDIYEHSNVPGNPIAITHSASYNNTQLYSTNSAQYHRVIKNIQTNIQNSNLVNAPELRCAEEPQCVSLKQSFLHNFKEVSRHVYSNGIVQLNGSYPCQGMNNISIVCKLYLHANSSLCVPVLLLSSTAQALGIYTKKRIKPTFIHSEASTDTADVSSASFDDSMNHTNTYDQDQQNVVIPDSILLYYLYIDTKGLVWLKSSLTSNSIPISTAFLPYIYPVSSLAALYNSTFTVRNEPVYIPEAPQATILCALRTDPITRVLTITRADSTQLIVFPSNDIITQYSDGTRIFVESTSCSTATNTTDLLQDLNVYTTSIHIEHPTISPICIKRSSLSANAAYIDNTFDISTHAPRGVSVEANIILPDLSILTRHPNMGITFRKRYGALYVFSPCYTQNYESDLIFENPNTQGLYAPISTVDDDLGVEVYKTHPSFSTLNPPPNSTRMSADDPFQYAQEAAHDPRMLLPRSVVIVPRHILEHIDKNYQTYGICGNLSVYSSILNTSSNTSFAEKLNVINASVFESTINNSSHMKWLPTNQTEYEEIIHRLYQAQVPLSLKHKPTQCYFLDMRAGHITARDAHDDWFTADLSEPAPAKAVNPISFVPKNVSSINSLKGHAGWAPMPEQPICTCADANTSGNGNTSSNLPPRKTTNGGGSGSGKYNASKDMKKLVANTPPNTCPQCNLPLTSVPKPHTNENNCDELLLTPQDADLESANFGANADLIELRYSDLVRNSINNNTKHTSSLSNLLPFFTRNPEPDTTSRLFILFRQYQHNTMKRALATHPLQPYTATTTIPIPMPFTHGFANAIELCSPLQIHIRDLIKRIVCNTNSTILPIETIPNQNNMKLYRFLTPITFKPSYYKPVPDTMLTYPSITKTATTTTSKNTAASASTPAYVQSTLVDEIWVQDHISKHHALASWRAYNEATCVPYNETLELIQQGNTLTMNTVEERTMDEIDSELTWIISQSKALQKQYISTNSNSSTNNTSSTSTSQTSTNTAEQSKLLKSSNSRVPLSFETNTLPVRNQAVSKELALDNYFSNQTDGTIELAINDLFARSVDVYLLSNNIINLLLPLLSRKFTRTERSIVITDPEWLEIVKVCTIDILATLLETIGFQQQSQNTWTQCISDDLLVKRIRIYARLSEKYIAMYNTSLKQHDVEHEYIAAAASTSNSKRAYNHNVAKHIQEEIQQVSKQYTNGVETSFGNSNVVVKNVLSKQTRMQEKRIRERAQEKVVHEKWGKSFVDKSTLSTTKAEDREVALKSSQSVNTLTAREMQKLHTLTKNPSIVTATVPTYSVKYNTPNLGLSQQLSKTVKSQPRHMDMNMTQPATAQSQPQMLVLPPISRK